MSEPESPWLGVWKTMRPHQWVKNGFVLSPVLFAHQLFDVERLSHSLIAMGLFCLASSAVYFLNDLVDVAADRAHPVKKNRPIARGTVPLTLARGVTVALALIAVLGGAALEPQVGVVVLAYLALNVAYSLRLKAVAYVDVLCIAAGFELRVLAGSYAADVVASHYLLLATGVLAVFLGFGKRYQEALAGAQALRQRTALGGYHLHVLRLLLHGTALATVAVYLAYVLDPHTAESFGSPWLLWTTPMPAIGVFRFLQLAKDPELRRRRGGESPTQAMLHDWPFLLNLLVWVVVMVGLIYAG